MSWEDDFNAMIGLVDTSYDQPRTESTVTQDIVTQRQDVTTGGNDAWGSFFRGAIGNVLEYGLKRDLAVTGAQVQQQQLAAQRAGYYLPGTATASGQGITMGQVLLIGGIVVVALVASK